MFPSSAARAPKCLPLNPGAGGFSASHFHPALTDPGDAPGFTMLGTTMRLIATAAGTEGRFTVFEQVTPAGGPPLGDERRTVSAGACAILPRDVPHGFRKRGVRARPIAIRNRRSRYKIGTKQFRAPNSRIGTAP